MNRSTAEAIATLPLAERRKLLADMDPADCRKLLFDWGFWARPEQLAPQGDWFCWLVLAGRGYGKTRMGAEYLRSRIEGKSPLAAPRGAPKRIALVAQTMADAREVMVAGESGLMAVCPPGFRPKYESTRGRLVWPNGVQAYLYSAEEPNQLRGPQHHAAWADEIAKWRTLEETWSNLVLGLRLGSSPRLVATTTPRPLPFLKGLIADPATHVTRGRTADNAANLSRSFMRQVERLYGGTRIGRQELDGEMLDDLPGALFSRVLLDAGRVNDAPPLERIVVAVDPPVTSGPDADACGIVAAGLDARGHVYVLKDATLQGESPARWATAAIALYHALGADRLVAEVNNGGDLVETLVRQVDETVSFRSVHASRGKIARAEPVAALYERGLVHHVGGFAALEDQMCRFAGARLEGGGSPDRLDALVWAVTVLKLEGSVNPKFRRVI